MKLVFLDTETTGLEPDRHDIWELAAIRRDAEGDHEYAWQLRPSLINADPTALRIGRYYERNKIARYESGVAWTLAAPGLETTPDDDQKRFTSTRAVIGELAGLLDGAYLVGACPWFDEKFLNSLMRNHNFVPTHNYHLVDIESFAAGASGTTPPWKLDTLLTAHGLSYEAADRHTALGDARRVRDLYDAVMASR